MVPIIPRGLLVSFDNIACVSTTSPVCLILSSCNITLSASFGNGTDAFDINHADQVRLYQSEIHAIDHVCSLV